MLWEGQEKLWQVTQAAAECGEEPEELLTDVLQDSGTKFCCMRKALSEQQEFKDEKPLLQIVIEEAGHMCYFLPKFHCELNPIEMYWGWMKMHESHSVSNRKFPTAKCLVPGILNSCPINTIHAFFQKTWHCMDAYHKGLDAKQAEFAVKKYKSHQHCGPAVMMSIGVILN
ncbi:hypothetical protein PAXRUDRAFT_152454 [Paxillus rubicundulus Ve08.2h10]|uniref:Tc1-like transposase DDE domain-containing protein n=1 Tax=Paxillus rubicundulus Ve08.2h10 TaxID=930991 RepID=A0A0D0DWW4_9AGAM|nr:hypothetical protein PAXRUDRAFT_152454 [Paxillus rubicundulus Ve08.2h10]